MFHLRIAKVDLNVWLSSDEERASAGAMTASMWGGGACLTTPVWKRWAEKSSKQRGRGGHEAVWKTRGLSHPDDMGSGAEGSSLNAGTGSRVGVGDARIRETRTEKARVSGLSDNHK
jgi:hypothetical protein